MASQHADDKKLRELILYLATRMERDQHAGQGRIKLAKLLWLTDFEAYRRFGRSIDDANAERAREDRRRHDAATVGQPYGHREP